MAEGRRERLRERKDRAGVMALADHEIIEFFLYKFVKRQDTGDIGRALIKHYGSLYQVFRAPLSEILQFADIPYKAALQLCNFLDFCSATRRIKTDSEIIISCQQRATDLFMTLFLDKRELEFCVAFCGARINLVTCISYKAKSVDDFCNNYSSRVLAFCCEHNIKYVFVGCFDPCYVPALRQKQLIDNVSGLKAMLSALDIVMYDFQIINKLDLQTGDCFSFHEHCLL